MVVSTNNKKINNKEYQMTYLCEDKSKQTKYYLDVVESVIKTTSNWSTARKALEQDWEECWSHYLSNWRANTIIERNTVMTVGDVSNDFRHKIPTSKAFELVETVNSYLQDAIFPTRNWFDLKPKQPMGDDWQETTMVLNEFILNKLEEANFREYCDSWIRQACVVGTSVLALPWAYETRETQKNVLTATGGVKAVPYTKVERNGFDFEVVDMYDFYIDPSAQETRRGDVVRRIVKKRGEVIRLIQSGLFPLGNLEEVLKTPSYSSSGGSLVSEDKRKTMRYMNGIDEFKETDDIELLEFYGHLTVGECEYLDVHAIVGHDNLYVFEPNPYWGGKPFVIATLINGHCTPYGTGLLQPILGSLHMLYINQNHRLDVDELTIDPMFLVKSDGSVNVADVYTAPGRVIQVEDPETDIVPLQLQNTTLNNNLTDEQILEDRINRSTGVGDYVGVNAGRDAERVTAREVEARQQAGGNRLGRYHKHIETTALREFLVKAYEYMKQFITEDSSVRVQRPNKSSIGDNYDYFSVGQVELQNEMDIIPIGADHVVDKEYELRSHIDFYSFIQGNPQLSQFVNWKEVIKDLARRLIKDDWMKYVLLPEENNTMGVDSATGQSTVDQIATMSQALNPGGQQQGATPVDPTQMMQQQQAQPKQASYDNQKMQQMLAANPQLAQQMTNEYVINNLGSQQ